jgi:hypothetical protein
MPTVPASPPYHRVRVWRRLQEIGAVALKNSVYVLPRRDECVETFEWIAREIAELGGSSSLCDGHFLDAQTDREIERRFAEASDAEFLKLVEAARPIAKALRGKRIGADRLRELEAQHAKLERRLREIVATDYGRASRREEADGLIAAIGLALADRREPKVDPPRVAPKPRGAVWVTRTGVHVDRIASAWLVRRFVDPEARFKFVQPKGYVPEPGELRFDMFEAEFTHEGALCTFEVIMSRFGLDDPGLSALGEVVHDIDLRDQKFSRPETDGVAGAITGICLAHREDEARIAAAAPLLDAYLLFFRQPKSKRAEKTK